MNSEPIVLAFRFSAKKLARLRMAAMRLGIRVRVVAAWEYLNSIGSFTGDLGSFDTMYDGPGFQDEMLVLAHFPDGLIDRFLAALRAAGLPPVPCKAVLTETNMGWNALELHEQLREEHEAVKKGLRAHGESEPQAES